ncbi:MAG: SpoIIE family protein phosphatase [bacterium]
MKRILYTASFFIIITILGVLWFGTGNYIPMSGIIGRYSPVRNWYEYLTHFGVSWMIGIVVAGAIAIFVRTILTTAQRHWCDRNFKLIALSLYFFSLLLGAKANQMVYAAISFMGFDLYPFLLSYTLMAGVLYVLYTIAERMRQTRENVPGYDRRRIRSIGLILKLSITGMIIFLITLLFRGSDWNYSMQVRIRMARVSWDESDIVRVLSINTLGLSHSSYLEAMAKITTTLTSAGVKVIIVPLPEGIGETDYLRDEAITAIARHGNVVFAIPAKDRSLPTPFSIDRPVKRTTPITYGVISAAARIWYYPDRYYPLSYWENESEELVPDVSVQAVRLYRGYSDNSELSIQGNAFIMPGYKTGLMKDQSTFINPRIFISYADELFAHINEVSDSITYTKQGVLLSDKFSQAPWTTYSGKIVIIQPPAMYLTKINNFTGVYATIIHNILENQQMWPLDRWTPYITIAAITMTLLCILFLNTVRRVVAIILFIFMQWYFYYWLVASYFIIVEPLPPILATMLGLFAFSFVLLAHDRKMQERIEKQRLQEELKTAHDMQMGLMPTHDPVVPGYDISGVCRPAYEVGGDYFDYLWLNDEKTKIGIAIADVSGKAMKAAITAVMTSGMVYREISGQDSPRTILMHINRPLYLKTDRRMFTAMSFGVIDIHENTLSYSNAGQISPLLRRGSEIQSIKVEGPRLPLGVQEIVEYGETTVKLVSGDVIVFLTDGIVEAKNEKREFWGFERMEASARKLDLSMTAKQIVDAILAEVTQFAGSAHQHDDMTVVVVKVN